MNFQHPNQAKLNELIAAEKIQIIQRFDFSFERPMQSAEMLERLFLQLAEVDKKYSDKLTDVISKSFLTIEQRRELLNNPPKL